MTRSKRVTITQPPRGKATWTCTICQEKGTAPSERVARAEFDMHYRKAHYTARKAGA